MTWDKPGCDNCGGDQNVINFVHFDHKEPEYLCSPCRRPIITKRIHGKPNERNPEPGEEWSPPSREEVGPGKAGQSGISDWL